MGELLGQLVSAGTVYGAHSAAARGYEGEILGAIEAEIGIDKALELATTQAMGAGESLAEPLTEREGEVLALLAAGLSNKEMADRLYVAPSTIKQHLKNIYGKLDVHNRLQAVQRAREIELIA